MFMSPRGAQSPSIRRGNYSVLLMVGELRNRCQCKVVLSTYLGHRTLVDLIDILRETETQKKSLAKRVLRSVLLKMLPPGLPALPLGSLGGGVTSRLEMHLHSQVPSVTLPLL